MYNVIKEFFFPVHLTVLGFPGSLVVKNLPANAEDEGLIPGSERSPGGGCGNPLQYCLENPMREEPSGLQSIGSPRVGHNRSTWAAARRIYLRLKWRQPGSSIHTPRQRQTFSVKGYIVTVWSSVGPVVSVTVSQFLTKTARNNV